MEQRKSQSGPITSETRIELEILQVRVKIK